MAFSTTALDKNAGFMLKVLEHILMTWPTAQPEYKVFNEAIKDLQTESLVELQRLASKMPDHLLVSSTLCSQHSIGIIHLYRGGWGGFVKSTTIMMS